MAIAFDNVSSGGTGSGTSLTFASASVTGSDRMGIVAITTGTDSVTSVTWNGVAMTQACKRSFGSYPNYVYIYALHAIATGSTNIVISTSATVNIEASAASYTGVNQSSTLDATNTNGAGSNATSGSVSITSVSDNCWLVSAVVNTSGDSTASTNTTKRVGPVGPDNHVSYGDSNAAMTPAGANTQAWTWTTNSHWSVIGGAMAPSGGGGGAVVRAGGLLMASLATN